MASGPLGDGGQLLASPGVLGAVQGYQGGGEQGGGGLEQGGDAHRRGQVEGLGGQLFCLAEPAGGRQQQGGGAEDVDPHPGQVAGGGLGVGRAQELPGCLEVAMPEHGGGQGRRGGGAGHPGHSALVFSGRRQFPVDGLGGRAGGGQVAVQPGDGGPEHVADGG